MENRTYADYLLIAALSLVFCTGFVHYGMPRGHDIMYEMTRVAEFSHSLKNGGFPVRWSANLDAGFGQPIFNFFPPLFLTISSIQIILGLSITNAIKGSIFILTLVGGIGMYMFTREFYERNGSLISACIYIISPYHIVDIYARSAYSEYTACSLAPFVFWGIILVLKKSKFDIRLILLLSTIGSLFALSHNLSLLMYTPLFFIFFFFNFVITQNIKSLISIVTALLLTALLSAFFIVPIFYEMEFIQMWRLTAGDILSKNYSTLGSLFGFSSLYSLTPFSLILFISILVAMIFKKEKMNKILYANLCLFIGFFSILLFLTTSSSKIVWKSLSFMELFQFPWRLLSPATFALCFLSGSLIYFRDIYQPLFPSIDKNIGNRFVLLIIVLILFIASSILIFFFGGNSNRYVVKADGEFSSEKIRKENLRATAAFEYRPIWAQEKKESPISEGLTCSNSNASIKAIKIRTNHQTYEVSLSEKCVLTANIHYFPGWKIYNNGNSVPFDITPKGLMEFALQKGVHNLEIVFEDTFVRKLGDYLSIFGLFGFGILFLIDTIIRMKFDKPSQKYT